jgi:murein L,D-transpeptidase YcbB/YkuD
MAFLLKFVQHPGRVLTKLSPAFLQPWFSIKNDLVTMKKLLPVATFLFLLFTGCHQPASKQMTAAKRDTSITATNAYSDLFLDSSAVDRFIATKGINDSAANHLRIFYAGRNYQYAWFFGDGIADYAATFLDLQNDYMAYSGDSSLYNPRLQLLYDSVAASKEHFNRSDSIIPEMELLFTEQFFRYARRAYQGINQLNVKELDWFIPRKKINPAAMLDSLIKYKGKDVTQYEPVNRQYNLLKNFLLKYYSIEKSGEWETIPHLKKAFRRGDSSAIIVPIKKNLLLTGDLSQADSSALFDNLLEQAVKNFQHRFGLTEDGVIGPSFLKELTVSPAARIRQLLINMERIRWVPAEPGTDYLLVNIPEFRLHVYEKGRYLFGMNVVVGQTAHQTVIFNGTLKYVVFSPYWNIPQSIIKNEILPALSRNKNYLETHNMERYGNGIRQKPGPDNALGLVKFLFPNNYNIYLHDTPAKSLFGESKRAFSHGCIRLSEAKKLAEFLLRNDADWNAATITRAMKSGRERYVTLRNPVPVFIGYFTAWVDREGQLNFRNDIYGHDKQLAGHLFNIADQ